MVKDRHDAVGDTPGTEGLIPPGSSAESQAVSFCDCIKEKLIPFYNMLGIGTTPKVKKYTLSAKVFSGVIAIIHTGGDDVRVSVDGSLDGDDYDIPVIFEQDIGDGVSGNPTRIAAQLYSGIRYIQVSVYTLGDSSTVQVKGKYLYIPSS